MGEIGAKIRNPHTDWEWRAYRGGETARYCADCGEQFTPRARVQKYCVKCKPNHRGWKHYERKNMQNITHGFKPCTVDDIATISGSKYGAYKAAVKSFYESGYECMSKTYDTESEARHVRDSLQQATRCRELSGKVKVKKRGSSVFMVRVD